MGMQDLPTETILAITDELVSDIGIYEAWKLRIVCKAFATAIKDNLLLKQSIASFPHYKTGPLLQMNLGPYLEWRLKIPLDCHKLLIKFIKEMIEFVLHISSSSIAGSDGFTRDKATQSVCAIVSSNLTIGQLSLFRFGWHFGGVECSESTLSLTDADKLAVLMELGWYEVAETALKGGSKHYSAPHRNIFGRPLVVATRLEKYCLVGLLLKDGFKDSKWTLSSFTAAIKKNDLEQFTFLTALHRDNHASIPSDAYHEILKAAIQSRNIGFLTKTFDIKTNARTKVTRENFKIACKLDQAEITEKKARKRSGRAKIEIARHPNQADVIKILLEKIIVSPFPKDDPSYLKKRLANNPSAGQVGYCPLRIAIEAKANFQVLELALAHPDVDVNGSVRKSGLSPLGIAVTKEYCGAVSLLLKNGANPNEQCSESHRSTKQGPRQFPDLQSIALKKYSSTMFEYLRNARLRLGEQNLLQYEKAHEARLADRIEL